MNERVETLARQAFGSTIDTDPVLVYEAEQFAKLIVRQIVTGLRSNAECLVGTGSDNEAFVLRTYASGLEVQYGIKE